MAMMTSDQIDHLHVLHEVAIPNSSKLIHHSHRGRLWSFEELRFSEEANKATSSEKPPHHTCNNHILHHNVNTNHTPFDRQGPTPSDTHTRTGTETPPSTVPSPSTTHSLSTSQPNLVEILSETMHPVFF